VGVFPHSLIPSFPGSLARRDDYRPRADSRAGHQRPPGRLVLHHAVARALAHLQPGRRGQSRARCFLRRGRLPCFRISEDRRLRRRCGVLAGRGGIHRRHHRAPVPLSALQQGSGTRPAVHVRPGDGGRANAAHEMGDDRPAVLDSRCAARSAARRRFHLLVLSAHDPRGDRGRGERLLAAAQQDRVRHGGTRRGARPGDGACHGHQLAPRAHGGDDCEDWSHVNLREPTHRLACTRAAMCSATFVAAQPQPSSVPLPASHMRCNPTK